MKINKSNLSNHVLKTVNNHLGDIYFFNHIAVIEFNEGVHIDINTSENLFIELSKYFGNSRPFGVVANRVNSYSVKLMDVDLFRKKSKNLCAYGVVGYNQAGKMNAEIENSFCKASKINFDNLYEALDTVYNKVKKQILVSLN